MDKPFVLWKIVSQCKRAFTSNEFQQGCFCPALRECISFAINETDSCCFESRLLFAGCAVLNCHRECVGLESGVIGRRSCFHSRGSMNCHAGSLSTAGQKLALQRFHSISYVHHIEDVHPTQNIYGVILPVWTYNV